MYFWARFGNSSAKAVTSISFANLTRIMTYTKSRATKGVKTRAGSPRLPGNGAARRARRKSAGGRHKILAGNEPVDLPIIGGSTNGALHPILTRQL